MGSHLPPDLDRLGVTLTEATARAAAARRHQAKVVRQLSACVAAGMIVFAATPGHLGPATPPAGGLFGLEAAYGSVHRGPCDPPHGTAKGCHDADPPPQAR